jgi:hypothetical protein
MNESRTHCTSMKTAQYLRILSRIIARITQRSHGRRRKELSLESFVDIVISCQAHRNSVHLTAVSDLTHVAPLSERTYSATSSSARTTFVGPISLPPGPSP